MAARKSTSTVSRKRKQSQQPSKGRRVSAFIGGTCILLALLGFIWVLARQAKPVTFALAATATPAPPATTTASATSATANIDPLAAAGITLTAPASNQSPVISQQQALYLASQDEPEVAGAGAVSAQYTLCSYSGSAAQPASLHAVPVWLIHYSNVPEPRPDTSADPQAGQISHDLYVFLAASNGQELLALWL